MESAPTIPVHLLHTIFGIMIRNGLDTMRPNFFAEGSPYLGHPLLTGKRSAKEVEFLVKHFDLQEACRVLDVGCGFGRHSVELARRGYSVVGIDPAPAMIQAARHRAAQMNVTPCFHQTSAQDFASEKLFDAAICLFTTLGQIRGDDDRDNTSMLATVCRLLLPGGFLAVEIPQRAPTVRLLKRSDRFGSDTHFTQVERQYDPGTHSVTEIFSVVSPQKRRQYLLRYRLYSEEELEAMLVDSGICVTARYGNYDGEQLQPESPSMLMIGRKC